MSIPVIFIIAYHIIFLFLRSKKIASISISLMLGQSVLYSIVVSSNVVCKFVCMSVCDVVMYKCNNSWTHDRLISTVRSVIASASLDAGDVVDCRSGTVAVCCSVEWGAEN